jgi:glycosyltransferase involved in cell wall biosynthesis
MRGLWADERIEVGTLRRGSVEERIMRRIERGAAQSAGAIVALAGAAIPVLADRHGSRVAAKVHVIPTCVDLDRFPFSDMPPPEPLRLLLSGTLNARYDVPTMIRFVERLRSRRPTELEVLVPDGSPWKGRLGAADARIAYAHPSDMPAHVARAHGGLGLVRPSPTGANVATVPTKLGEFLATGRPVVVSAGLGDMNELLARFDCGVVVAAEPSDGELDRAADELERLVGDPTTPDRCRVLAASHFDLRVGVSKLRAAYETIVARP